MANVLVLLNAVTTEHQGEVSSDHIPTGQIVLVAKRLDHLCVSCRQNGIGKRIEGPLHEQLLYWKRRRETKTIASGQPLPKRLHHQRMEMVHRVLAARVAGLVDDEPALVIAVRMQPLLDALNQ